MTLIIEYLRGNSATDECESLFKQYKSCLTVSYKIFEILIADDADLDKRKLLKKEVLIP